MLSNLYRVVMECLLGRKGSYCDRQSGRLFFQLFGRNNRSTLRYIEYVIVCTSNKRGYPAYITCVVTFKGLVLHHIWDPLYSTYNQSFTTSNNKDDRSTSSESYLDTTAARD